MATATLVARTVIDNDPDGSAEITVAIEKDNGLWIIMKQDQETVAMRVEHADAVHAALGACISEFKELAA